MKTIIKKVRKKHIKELALYGIIGVIALFTQMFIYTILCYFKIIPLVSSIFGSISGMILGYFGHTKYTFKKIHKFSHKEFIKYIITGIICLSINSISVYVLTDLFNYSSHIGLLPMFLTPLMSFLISKFWAFK
jgi:putative flippase GtrA